MNSLRVNKNNIDKIINELKVLPTTSDIVFKNLFRDKSMKINDIIDITGLSKEEIQKIEENY